MESIDEKIGRRVRSYRKAAGINQVELADRVDVSKETISRLERGVAMPSVGRLYAIARALGAELHELLRIDAAQPAKAEALERLVAVASQGDAADVEMLAGIAELVVDRLSGDG